MTIKCSRISRNGTRSFGKRLKSEQIKSTDKKSNFSVETYGITWKFQRAACLSFSSSFPPLLFLCRSDRIDWFLIVDFIPLFVVALVVGIDFSSLVLTSSALRMHRFPGYALKVSFIALLGPGAAIYFPRTHLRPEAIRTTYTRSLPGDSVYFRNSIPSTGTEVHSRVAHRVTITFLSRSGLSSLNVLRAPMR